MPKISDIDALNITLEIEGKQSLFILLANDGLINRSGTGTINNEDNNLYMGVSKNDLLSKALSHLTDDLLDYMGGYDIPDQKGLPCLLSIGLHFKNGENNGFGFSYGSESEGPPLPINNFVRATVKLTEPWYQEQLRMVSENRNNKET